MSLIVIAVVVCAVCKAISAAARACERQNMEKIKEEQRRQRDELLAERRAARTMMWKQAALEREQERQREELEKHEAWLTKHDEQIAKLEMRLSAAEREIAFNREQRERLWKLLEIEQMERDAAIEGSRVWQKHHAKVISLENQIHTVQKRLDKAQETKYLCEQAMSA